MEILNTSPITWQKLQEYVGNILLYCGYDVTIEKDIDTARGKVNVDVYAFRESGYKSIVICECKNWSNNIPQHVIHSFRTVINDLGADHGFIVAKKGFQSGAYEAVNHSNISILCWNEFMKAFTDSWLKQVIERNARAGRALQNFGSYLISNRDKVLPGLYVQHEESFLAYRAKYENLIFLSFEANYKTLLGHKVSRDEVDKRIAYFVKDIPIQVSSYTDYFDYIYAGLTEAVAGVEEIFNNQIKLANVLTDEQSC